MYSIKFFGIIFFIPVKYQFFFEIVGRDEDEDARDRNDGGRPGKLQKGDHAYLQQKLLPTEKKVKKATFEWEMPRGTKTKE